MEYNEDRVSLKNVPTFTLPPPPRFDAAASAAARPVEPLATTRIQIDLPQKPKFSRLINRRSKFLALMAIVGLATGAAGGILVVESDKQQSQNSASTIQLPAEQTSAFDSAAPALESSDASLEVSEPVDNQVPVRRRQRRPRQQPRRELVVLSHSEDDEELDRDEDDDDDKDKLDRDEDDDDKDKNDDARKKNRGDRNRAVLYDVLPVRKP